jgi:septal ring factor EnvC (AmiA/AmiB activator)
MQRVPEALAALPEIQRQNSCLMEMLNDRFNEQKEHSNRFANTLEAMNKSSTRQTDVLGLIQQQLAENHASIMKRADALANLNEAIIQLADSNANTGKMLDQMMQINRSRDEQLTAVISRTQRWIVATLLCCGGASLAALVTALIALVS